MGCCSSSSSRTPQKPTNSLPSLAENTVYPKQQFSGLQIRVSAACWTADSTRGASKVEQTDTGLFAAIFEGHGGPEASDYCLRHVQQEFLMQRITEGKDRILGMQKVLHTLDAKFLAEETVPAQTRASVGASGALLFLEAATDTLHVASVGDCGCVLGSLDHGLANQRSQGTLLTRATQEPGPDAEARLIGFGRSKSHNAGDQAKTGSMPLPYASCHVRVATRRLTPLDEHILLGSETFWSLVSPGDAALRSHLHLKAHSGFKPGFDATAPASMVPTASLTNAKQGHRADVPNTAEHMVLWAMLKAASAIGRKVGRKVSLKSLEPLPLAPAHPPAKKQRSVCCCFGGPRTMEESAVAAPRPVHRGFHGDVGLVAVALRWPSASLNQAFVDELRSGMKGLQAPDVPRMHARFRWRQIRTLCVEFARQRRRLLLQKWWQVVEAEVRAAKGRAQKLEEMVWREQGIAIEASPSLRIKAKGGRVISKEDVATAIQQLQL